MIDQQELEATNELWGKIRAAQIYYLDTLKKYGVLDVAMEGKLPDKVHKAAMFLALSKFPGIPHDKETMTISVPQELQHKVDEEIEEYLVHYDMAKRGIPMSEIPILPRVFKVGGRYTIKSGSHAGKIFYNRGKDEKVYGISWMENSDNPACNRYVFRIERDHLPLNGDVYVGHIGKEDVLLHESEIGEMEN